MLIQQLMSMMQSKQDVDATAYVPRPKNFVPGQQQDSYEYLGFFLNRIQEEEKLSKDQEKLLITESTEKVSVAEKILMNMIEETDAAKDSKSFTDTLVDKIFGGQLTITHKCLKCIEQNTTVERFLDLQLSFSSPLQSNELNDGNYDFTTQSLVNSFFGTEELIGENQYFCYKCGENCDGERKITLEQGPSNLILVCKHFEFNRELNVRRKLMHKTHYEHQITLMSRSKDGGHMLLSYKLYAVIVHSGQSMDAGHYITYAVNDADNWLKLNDTNISSFDGDINSFNMHNTPYILFYKLQTDDENNGRSPNDQGKIYRDICLPILIYS